MPVAEKLRILFLSANPAGTTSIQAGEEYTALRDELLKTKHRDLIELGPPHFGVSAKKIQGELQTQQPAIVHLSVHGREDRTILLENEAGERKRADHDAIQGLFALRKYRSHLRLVVFNACFSEELARNFHCSGCNCIGMTGAISVEAGITYSQVLYRGIGDGLKLHEAHEQALAVLRVDHAKDADLPRLYEAGPSLALPEANKTDTPLPSVQPRFLRPYDQDDKEFFLRLLSADPTNEPDGLPQPLRDWKNSIENRAKDNRFAVGYILGPSGCGKTSLVLAGLLPRLHPEIEAIYLEASATTLVPVLRQRLVSHCYQISSEKRLTTIAKQLKKQPRKFLSEKKTTLLVVIDQFEQWLQANPNVSPHDELAGFLNQADGTVLKVLLLLRQEFFAQVDRLFNPDGIFPPPRLVPRWRVNHFGKPQAARALRLFAETRGEKPDSAEMKEFIQTAIERLSDNDEVPLPRLSVFVELMWAKEWKPGDQVSRNDGFTLQFIRQSFDEAKAGSASRFKPHALDLLRKLLPPEGVDLKKSQVSRSDLAIACGLGKVEKQSHLVALLHYLDRNLCLITPAEPRTDAKAPAEVGFYRLTHDYLVGPVRAWLKEEDEKAGRSWQGKAKALLRERGDVYDRQPEGRHLLGFFEWLYTLRLVGQLPRLEPKSRKLFWRSTALIGLHATYFLMAAIALIFVAGNYFTTAARQSLVARLEAADAGEVPDLLDTLARFRPAIEPLLRAKLSTRPPGSPAWPRLFIAIPFDGKKDELLAALESIRPEEMSLLLLDGGSLRLCPPDRRHELMDALWQLVDKGDASRETRLQAAYLLAGLSPEDSRWKSRASEIAEKFVSTNLELASVWIKGLLPVGKWLETPLWCHFLRRGNDASSIVARQFLVALYRDDPRKRAELVLHADERHLRRLLPLDSAIKPFLISPTSSPSGEERQNARGLLSCLIDLPRTLGDESKPYEAVENLLARKRANAALVSYLLGDKDALREILRYQDDPRARSYVIHGLGPAGVPTRELVKLLVEETDVSVRRALVLALYGCPWESNRNGRNDLVTWLKVVAWLKKVGLPHADAGLHAASECLLRKLVQPVPDITRDLLALQAQAVGPSWFNAPNVGTMVVLPRGKFRMGTPSPAPLNAEGRELAHLRSIPRVVAIAAREVTVKQYNQFLFETFSPEQASREYSKIRQTHSPTGDHPVNNVNWFMATRYCDWLSKKDPTIGDTNACYQAVESAKKLSAGYLDRSGYRLPTEAEWEYACRAGAETLRPYGEDVTLLTKYAWVPANTAGEATRPVGQLMPNDFGFYDMLGNVLEWCSGPFAEYPNDTDGKSDRPIAASDRFVMRGGSFYNPASRDRSGYRYKYAPGNSVENGGFRVARMIRPLIKP